MDNFKITKTILENINEQNERINECIDIVNGYTTDEETRVNQELQRQQNEVERQEQYNNNNNKFVTINKQLEDNTSRIKDISINVKSFGAKGDGITDDTQAIQNAIDYVGEQGGGIVFFPKGVYSIRIQTKPGWLYQDDLGCLYIKYSNITLKGVGVGKTIIKQVSYNGLSNETDFIVDNEQNKYYRGNMFKIGTKENPVTNNITIENIEFDGGCPNLPSDGLNWGNTDITNGSGWDISHKCLYYLNYGETNRCDNFNIHDNLFKNFRGEVIYGGGNNTGNVNIYNNKILNSVTGISGNGHFNIYNNNFENILNNIIECLITAGSSLIHSNMMLSSGCGINLQSHSVGFTIPTVKIYDNHIENIKINAGIYLAGAKNVEVYNNTILDSNKGIWISDFTSNALNDGLSKNITIKQNKIGTHKNANVSNPNNPSNIGIHTMCDSNRNIIIQDNIFFRTEYAEKNNFMLDRSLVLGTIKDDFGLILNNNIVMPNASYHGCPISSGWFDLNSSNSTTVYYQGYLMGETNETLPIDAKYFVYRPVHIEVYGTLSEPSQVVITIQYQNKLNEQKTKVIYDEQVDTMFSFQYTLLALLQGVHSYGSRMELNIRVGKPNIAQIQYNILQK